MEKYAFLEKLYGNDFIVKNYIVRESAIEIVLKSKSKHTKCPFCGKETRTLHSTYSRRISDTPIQNKSVVLNITAYRYYCENSECSCKVFAEPLLVADKKKRRTMALDQLILAIAYEFSSEGASRILKRLGVHVSNDTIDKLIAKIEIKDNLEIEKIGVDDFAYRKGQTYCTAIYDMESHKPIAILNGRSSEELKKWLSGHKKVTVVARDRDSAYAKAISEVLPNCLQVADKFHIMQNLLNAIKEIAKEEIPLKIYIENQEIIENSSQINAKKRVLNRSYDNSPVIDSETGEIIQVTTRKKYSKDYLSLKRN